MKLMKQKSEEESFKWNKELLKKGNWRVVSFFFRYMFLIIYQEIRVIKQTNELTGHTFRVSRSFYSLYIQFPFNPIQLNSIQSNLVLQRSWSFSRRHRHFHSNWNHTLCCSVRRVLQLPSFCCASVYLNFLETPSMKCFIYLFIFDFIILIGISWLLVPGLLINVVLIVIVDLVSGVYGH